MAQIWNVERLCNTVPRRQVEMEPGLPKRNFYLQTLRFGRWAGGTLDSGRPLGVSLELYLEKRGPEMTNLMDLLKYGGPGNGRGKHECNRLAPKNKPCGSSKKTGHGTKLCLSHCFFTPGGIESKWTMRNTFERDDLLGNGLSICRTQKP